MNCVSALSTDRMTETALRDVLERAARGLEGATADLALVFGSMHHAGMLGTIAQRVRDQGIARHVLGCTGESIIAEDREIEGAPALGLWAITLPGVNVRPVRLTFDEGEFEGFSPTTSGNSSTLILLGDPFSFPTDMFLKQLNDAPGGPRVVGGMASGGDGPGTQRIVLDDACYDSGAVAVALEGPVRVRTVVSQGCRPIGRPMIVTRAERNIIRELGRRPILEVLRETFDLLTPDDQRRVREGLHIGRVINEYQESFHRGDFLVRNVVGADEAGGIAITDVIRVGQTVQFHVRDAESADEDLRGLLELERQTRPDAKVKGALLFSCNGRGTRLFAEPNHDVATIHQVLGPVPVAGFFAMGEIGPIGGQNFLHGFTASAVLFEE